jgi:hypothetical protein
MMHAFLSLRKHGKKMDTGTKIQMYIAVYKKECYIYIVGRTRKANPVPESFVAGTRKANTVSVSFVARTRKANTVSESFVAGTRKVNTVSESFAGRTRKTNPFICKLCW